MFRRSGVSIEPSLFCRGGALPATEPPVRFLASDDIERLLAATPSQFWRAAILTILRAGLRIGELIALEWQDIDVHVEVLTVRGSWVRGHVQTPKAHRIRYVPLAPDLIDALHALPRTGDRVFDLRLRDPYQFLRRRMIQFGIRAGITRPGWHLLRHTFGTELTRIGVNPLVTRDLLGHSTVRMTERYAHVSRPMLRNAIERLAAARAGELWATGGQRRSLPTVRPCRESAAPISLSPLGQTENTAIDRDVL